MQSMNRFVLGILAFMMSAGVAWAGERGYQLVVGKDHKFCTRVLEAFRGDVDDRWRPRYQHEIFRQITWKPIELRGQGPKTRHCSSLERYDLPFDRVIVELPYRSVIASAHWLPLTMALSRWEGQPVSVQAPATSKFAIGLRGIGRCNLVPGLRERIAWGIVRCGVDVTGLSAMRSPHDLRRSGIARSTRGGASANGRSVVRREKCVRCGAAAVTRTE